MSWRSWLTCASVMVCGVISDEIHMDMVWGEQPHIPWSNVARGDWAVANVGLEKVSIFPP
ncbi:protein MalY [includes: cystathionine beta-lyase; maltose regulon modulator] [Escherichia coli]|uniref:Protein MalY [includes: cystathionine beta-lyase maltose regulon modulator] n=1 Tax=Escherichia coli TaxID=562 RepID=A0A2X1NKG5_ECOLX|nr:protein MalY [includes: cystathionine beta-lyase; maltose regulon modulator] [Escherichia coli]